TGEARAPPQSIERRWMVGYAGQPSFRPVKLLTSGALVPSSTTFWQLAAPLTAVASSSFKKPSIPAKLSQPFTRLPSSSTGPSLLLIVTAPLSVPPAQPAFSSPNDNGAPNNSVLTAESPPDTLFPQKSPVKLLPATAPGKTVPVIDQPPLIVELLTD